MEMRPHSRESVTDVELDALTELANVIDPDRRLGDPPFTSEYVQANLDVETPFRRMLTWGAWEDDVLVGVGQFEASIGVDNANACDVVFGVHPHHRHRGLGQAIFGELNAYAATQGRTIVHPWVELNDLTRAFFDAAGYELAMDERISRVDMHQVDDSLMQSWIDQAAERASGYHLERWVGRCPEQLGETYVAALEGMNEAPNEGLTVERRQHSVERMRDREVIFDGQGQDVHVILAIETETGRAAGYTGVHVLRPQPSHSFQGDTTTLLDHRSRGIGRWMKAAMWQWLRDERPEVRFLDTGNADSNEAMLAINIAMGFTPEFHYGCWEHPSVKRMAKSGDD